MPAVSYVPPSSFLTAEDKDGLLKAATALKKAKGLVIMAGAGLGADSGIPTYRTNEDFWVAHPQLQHARLGIPEMSNSDLFRTDPALAWGFMASRLKLYRSSQPHNGYYILKRWSNVMECGYFVLTSNVDRHFLRAGFPVDRVVERHGSLEFLQSLHTEVSQLVWPTPMEFNVRWDPETLRAHPPFPSVSVRHPSEKCAHPPQHIKTIETSTNFIKNGTVDSLAECQQCETKTHLLRPNMRLYNDDQWIHDHILQMEEKFHHFVRETLVGQSKNFVVIEIGVGVTVDTVRPTTDKLVKEYGDQCTLIRINPIEPEIPDKKSKHISLRMTGRKALEGIDEYLQTNFIRP